MFQFTLKAARISCGYSIEEIAKESDIEPSYYSIIEHDPGKAERNILKKILENLGAPPDLIYYGSEKSCIEKNRKNLNNIKKL